MPNRLTDTSLLHPSDWPIHAALATGTNHEPLVQPGRDIGWLISYGFSAQEEESSLSTRAHRLQVQILATREQRSPGRQSLGCVHYHHDTESSNSICYWGYHDACTSFVPHNVGGFNMPWPSSPAVGLNCGAESRRPPSRSKPKFENEKKKKLTYLQVKRAATWSVTDQDARPQTGFVNSQRQQIPPHNGPAPERKKVMQIKIDCMRGVGAVKPVTLGCSGIIVPRHEYPWQAAHVSAQKHAKTEHVRQKSKVHATALTARAREAVRA